MALTFIGASSTAASAGLCTVTVPVGTLPGDLMIVNALGRSSNMVPRGFNLLRAGSGAGETSFTNHTISWTRCPKPVPATVVAGTASNNSAASLVVYRADPGEGYFFDGTASASAASGQNITPGNITTTRASTVLMMPAANSASNAEIVTYGGAYTDRTSFTTTNRISTAIFEIAVGAGTTALPTVTLNRTEIRAFYAIAIYTAPVIGDWSFGTGTTASYQGAAAAYTGTSLVGGGDKIFMFGGSVSSTSNTMYDTLLETYTTKGVIPAATSKPSACAVGEYIYVLRGASVGFYRYNAGTNSWTNLANPPYSTTSSWLVYDGLGYIFAVGGSGTAGDTAIIMRYTIATDTWSAQSTLSDADGKVAALGSDGIIYSFGGYNGTTVRTVVQKVDPSIPGMPGHVTTGIPMPAARYYGSVAVKDDTIFYSGGFDSTFLAANTHWAYDVVTATWSTKTSMPLGTYQAGFAYTDSRMFVLGGRDVSNTTFGYVYIWDDPEVNGGILAADGVARASLYAEGKGNAIGQATTIAGEPDIFFLQGTEVDSFLDGGYTGSGTFDSIWPNTDIYPDIDIYPAGDF